MHIITKRFTFEAAHRLLGHPKCGRLHGHSYVVEVELRAAELPDSEMVRDYADLSAVKEFIDKGLDHRYLVSQELVDAQDAYWLVNPDEAHILPVQRTTAEALARYIFQTFKDRYPELTAVTVCETANTTATYRFTRGLR